MSQPTVCAVCLTADRQHMTDRAVRSFLAQDYRTKTLMIYDSGKVEYDWAAHMAPAGAALLHCYDPPAKLSIGRLRNEANALAKHASILIHWDSDDWSAPTRISDQVKLLQESGKQAVGYREMLFARIDSVQPWEWVYCHCGNVYPRSGAPCPKCNQYPATEAWLYSNTDTRYCLATSLCYWRSVWEAKPFPDAMIGSEREWLKGLDTRGVSCPAIYQDDDTITPVMIATLHGGNTVKNQISTNATNPDGSKMWTRVTSCDERVRTILEAA
jgi:hypothetical protein